MNVPDFHDVWYHGVKPPEDAPKKYDSTLTFTSDSGHFLRGVVMWDKEKMDYVFRFLEQPHEARSRYRIMGFIAILDPEDYENVTRLLREQFNIWHVEGVASTDDPAISLSPSSFFVEPGSSFMH